MLCVLAAAIAWPMTPITGNSAATMEEGMLLAGAELVLDGWTPHGSFEHLYGPGDVWFVAVAFALFGKSVLVERSVGLIYLMVLVTAVYLICRRWGCGLAAGAALLACLIIIPFGPIAYSWIGAIAAGAASLAVALQAHDRDWGSQPPLPGRHSETLHPEAAGQVNSWRVSGLLAGIALLLRADLVVALGLGLGPLLLGSWRHRVRPFVAGLSVGAAAYAVHLVTAGPSAVVQGMLVDPVFRLRPGRRLPLPPRLDDSSEFFARLDHYMRGPETLPGLDLPAQIAALFWIVIAAAVAAVWLAWRSGDRRLLAFALLAAGTLPQLLQRPSPNHLSFVGVLILPAAAVAVAKRLPWPRASVLVPVVVLGCLIVAAPHHTGRTLFRTYFGSPDTAQVAFGDRVLSVGDEQAAGDLMEMLQAVDAIAAPGDRIFVGPQRLARTNYSETHIYHMLPGYEPASYHLQMNPGLANREGGRLAADVASADWLILTTLFDGWTEPNTSVLDGDLRADAIVDESFCAVETAGMRTLYGKC